jgi:hypothetical protein
MNVTISYNKIFNVMTKMKDGGGIYLNGHTSKKHTNTVSHNWVDNDEHVFAVYYLDAGASHWHVTENVATNSSTAYAYLMNGGPGPCIADYAQNNTVDHLWCQGDASPSNLCAQCGCVVDDGTVFSVPTGQPLPDEALAIMAAAGAKPIGIAVSQRTTQNKSTLLKTDEVVVIHNDRPMRPITGEILDAHHGMLTTWPHLNDGLFNWYATSYGLDCYVPANGCCSNITACPANIFLPSCGSCGWRNNNFSLYTSPTMKQNSWTLRRRYNPPAIKNDDDANARMADHVKTDGGTLSKQTIEWWRWIRVTVQDGGLMIVNWTHPDTNMNSVRQKFLDEWENAVDQFEWLGDYRWQNGEFARRRGIVVSHAGEMEYEEAPLVVNILNKSNPNIVTDVWGVQGGIALDIHGSPVKSSADHPPPGGISRVAMTHVAPLWHKTVAQGDARMALFADTVTQDNSVGDLSSRGFSGGWSPVESARFVADRADLHLPKTFSIAYHIFNTLDTLPGHYGLEGEELIVEPITHAFILWSYTVWRDAWKDIYQLSARTAATSGRVHPPPDAKDALPAVYGNIGSDGHLSIAVSESPWHDVLFVENEGWQTDKGSPRPWNCYRTDGDPPDCVNTLATKVLQAANPGKPSVTCAYPENTHTTGLQLAESVAMNAIPFQEDGDLRGGTPVGAVERRHAIFVDNNRHLFEDRERVADTAVIWCLACVFWRNMGSLTANTSTTHTKYFTAIVRLMETHQEAYEVYVLPYHKLWNSTVPRDLRTYSTVVLPAVDAMSDSDVVMLSKFVHSGGNLVVGCTTAAGDVAVAGANDEELHPRLKPALADLMNKPGRGHVLLLTPSKLQAFVSGQRGAAEQVWQELTAARLPNTVQISGAPPTLWSNFYSHGNGSMLTVHLVNYSTANCSNSDEKPSEDVGLNILGRFACAVLYSAKGDPILQLNITRSLDGKATVVTIPSVHTYGIVALASTCMQIQLRSSASEARKWLQRLLIARRSYGFAAQPPNPDMESQMLETDQLLLSIQGISARPVSEGNVMALRSRLQNLSVKLKKALNDTSASVEMVQVSRRRKEASLCDSYSCVKAINFCGPASCGVVPGFQLVSLPNSSYTSEHACGFIMPTTMDSIRSLDSAVPDELHRVSFWSNKRAWFRVDVPQPGRYAVTVLSGTEDPTLAAPVDYSGGGYGGGGEHTSQFMIYSNTAVGSLDVAHASTTADTRHDVSGIYAAKGLTPGYYNTRSFFVNTSAIEPKALILTFGSESGSSGIGRGMNIFLWLISAIVVHHADGDSSLPPLVSTGLQQSQHLSQIVCRDIMWIGPFDSNYGRGLETQYPLELKKLTTTSLPQQTFVGKENTMVSWKRWQQPKGTAPTLPFGALAGNISSEAVAFAWTRLHRDVPGPVKIWATSSGLARIWVLPNSSSTLSTTEPVWTGELIAGVDDAIGGSVATVVLPRGWSTLVLKSVQTFGGDASVGKGYVSHATAEWASWVGVEDSSGRPVDCSAQIKTMLRPQKTDDTVAWPSLLQHRSTLLVLAAGLAKHVGAPAMRPAVGSSNWAVSTTPWQAQRGGRVDTSARTVGTLNAKTDFGAHGDGKHNDWAALQRAVWGAQSSESTLVIPAGVYLLNQSLNVTMVDDTVEGAPRGALRLRGEGMYQTILTASVAMGRKVIVTHPVFSIESPFKGNIQGSVIQGSV